MEQGFRVIRRWGAVVKSAFLKEPTYRSTPYLEAGRPLQRLFIIKLRVMEAEPGCDSGEYREAGGVE